MAESHAPPNRSSPPHGPSGSAWPGTKWPRPQKCSFPWKPSVGRAPNWTPDFPGLGRESKWSPWEQTPGRWGPDAALSCQDSTQ